ncbi:unnamed protein product [Boreogadus saida]
MSGPREQLPGFEGPKSLDGIIARGGRLVRTQPARPPDCSSVGVNTTRLAGAWLGGDAPGTEAGVGARCGGAMQGT